MYDHTAVLKLLIEWFEESQVIKEYDESLGLWVTETITAPNCFVLIAEHEKNIVGCVGVRQTEMPWSSKQQFLITDFLMIRKNARKTGAADKLIEDLKQYSNNTGLVLMMGHITGTDAELKDKFLQMKGFKYLGSNLAYLNKGE